MNADQLKELIDNSNNIVFFGGAGVSTASNIPDFRSAKGIFILNTKRNTRLNKFYRIHFL